MLVILLGGLLILMLAGIPVAFALGGITVIGFALDRGISAIPFNVVAQRVLYGINSYSLLAVPMFLLAGQIMNTGGITKRIFRFANCIVGHVRGGLAHVNVLASMIFAGMSGSSVADAAGLGAIEIEAMDDAGYDRDITIGVTAASSCVGPIIPPSTLFVIYAVSASLSVSRLLLAGLIPGIIMGGSLMVFASVIAIRRGYPSHPFPGIRELWVGFKEALPSLLTPVILLGGILSGIFTATEAASIAVLYSIVISCGVYREISLPELIRIFGKVVRDVGAILIILATASLYGWLIVRQRIPYAIAEALLSVTTNKFAMLLILNVFFWVVGCFMSATVAVTILAPILLPVVTRLGIDPVHFGVVMVFNLALGVVTPPFGQVLFVLARLTKHDFGFVVRSCIPWLIPLLVGLLMVTYWPGLSTWLPNMLLN